MSSHLLTFAENIVLETQRLILRPVELADAEDMYEYASDEETTKFVFKRHSSLEETRENIVLHFISKPLGRYGICLKETGKLIGTIDLRVDEGNKKAEMGYTLNKAYWGHGYTTEAGRELIKLAFEKLNLNCVEAKHDSRNLASGRVMEKLGMLKEAVMRASHIMAEEVTTLVVYGIIKTDYENQGE